MHCKHLEFLDGCFQVTMKVGDVTVLAIMFNIIIVHFPATTTGPWAISDSSRDGYSQFGELLVEQRPFPMAAYLRESIYTALFLKLQLMITEICPQAQLTLFINQCTTGVIRLGARSLQFIQYLKKSIEIFLMLNGHTTSSLFWNLE
jgi:hypothetical protein